MWTGSRVQTTDLGSRRSLNTGSVGRSKATWTKRLLTGVPSRTGRRRIPPQRQFSSQVPPSNSNAYGAPGAVPWDNLAYCLWIPAEMGTMVDSVLFRNGMGGDRDAVGIHGRQPNRRGKSAIAPVCPYPCHPVILKTHG